LEAQGTIFLHGGIAPSKIGSALAEIDAQVHREIEDLDTFRKSFVADGLVPPCAELPEMTIAAHDELARLDAAGAAAADTSDERSQLTRFLGWDGWSIFSADGPLWFRGYAKWSDEEGAQEMPKLLAAFGVERFVVGHTPQADAAIHCRFGGTACLVDTGMLASYFHGRASALEIAGDTLTAIYADAGRQPLPTETSPTPPAGRDPDKQAAPPPPSGATGPGESASRHRFLGADGRPLPFANDQALLAFLRDAKVIEVKDIGEGITRPRRLTLEKDGIRARVVFRNVSEKKQIATVAAGRREANLRDYFGFEPAAYQLSGLFGLDLVPPAELYRYEGQDGSIQIWVEKAITERIRREKSSNPPDALRWKRQLQTMLVWNEVVGDTDPNMGNILYGPDWEIWLIDHTRAFRQSTDLLQTKEIEWCPRALYEKLRTVPDDSIRDAVRGLLNPGEIRGLLSRRAKMVELLDRLIRERGESAVLFDATL
jgi:hypothetical protein